MAAAATPFPKEESTPPVIKMILVFTIPSTSTIYRPPAHCQGRCGGKLYGWGRGPGGKSGHGQGPSASASETLCSAMRNLATGLLRPFLNSNLHSKQLGIRTFIRRFGKILHGPVGGHPAPGGALQEAALDEEGFVYVFQGVLLFAEGRGQGAQAHGPAVVFLQDG